VCLARAAGPPLRRDVAVAIDTRVRLDTQLLREAVAIFAGHVPVTVEGLVDADPLARQDGVLGALAPMLDFADRLRARCGRPPLPRSRP
jgi:hypothetical protein